MALAALFLPAQAQAQDHAPPVEAASTAPGPASVAVPAEAGQPPRCPPPLPAAAAGPAIDRGMLWRLERDGRTSWLYGTVHLGRPEWAMLGPRVGAALAASDVLALEIDPHDPALQGQLAAQTRPAPLPSALAERLAQARHAACAAGLALAALHPLLQASTLMLLDARWLGLDPTYALEIVLSLRARAAGMPVIALETAARQMQALVPEQPAAMQAQLALTLQQLEDGSARRSVQRLTAAWEAGDLQTLADPATWCDCDPTPSAPGSGAGEATGDATSEVAGTVTTEAPAKAPAPASVPPAPHVPPGSPTAAPAAGQPGSTEAAFLAQINDARNPGLADGIAARHAAGQRVFAAVGALHMTGPAALTRLLAERGFEVERVAFDRPPPEGPLWPAR